MSPTASINRTTTIYIIKYQTHRLSHQSHQYFANLPIRPNPRFRWRGAVDFFGPQPNISGAEGPGEGRGGEGG